jgi:CSLREA domain-containing protein
MLALLTVTTDQDVVDLNDGQTSLREAIFAANLVPGADEIQFDFGHDGPATILLTEGELRIEDSLTITGPGAGLLTIDASGNDPTPDVNNGDGSRVINVTNQSALFLKGLTITGGDTTGDGAGIRAANLDLYQVHVNDNFTLGGGGGLSIVGQLVANHSVISGNTAQGLSGVGGIRLYGDAKIENCTISNNFTIDSFYGVAGGMLVYGSVEIKNSTISDNSTDIGSGGIRVHRGALTVTDSLITGNTGGSIGGGIGIRDGELVLTNTTIIENTNDDGGGVSIEFSYASIVNSTISHNSALDEGGGIYVRNSIFKIDHTTITHNHANTDEDTSGTGGGIYVRGAENRLSKINNSIVAHNTRNGEATDVVTLVSKPTISHSLIGSNFGSDFPEAPIGSPDANGNLIGGPIHGAIDPLLGPLADNGGPTLTHALLPGSPAIDAGDPALVAGVDDTPEFDQRGEPFRRIAGGRIDIGAFESQPLIVDTLADESDGDFSAGDFSLREAIELANQIAGANTIEFSPSLTDGTISLTIGSLNILDAVKVVGLGQDELTITNVLTQGPIFNVDDQLPQSLIEVSLAGLTLTGSTNSAIRNTEDLTVDSLKIRDNSGFTGGGIRVEIERTARGVGSKLTVRNSIFTNNYSTAPSSSNQGGGAIYLTGFNGQLTVENSVFNGNHANTLGGGIFVAGLHALVQIRDTTFDGNTAGQGGAVAMADDITEAVVPAMFERLIVTNNVGNVGGGGIYVSGKGLEIRDSHIAGNQAGATTTLLSGGGGGINKVGPGTFIIRGTTISDNHSDGDGGGIALVGPWLTLIDSKIEDNTAKNNGGGISIFGGSTIELRRATISGNSALSNGGGFYVWSGSSLQTRIFDSTISENLANKSGGGLYVSAGTINSINTTISGNQADESGGGFLLGRAVSQTSFRHNTVTNNTADVDQNGKGSGGGISAQNNVLINLDHTIVAGNFDLSGAAPEISGTVNSRYSLIGSGAAFLGPLADNGGPTKTHSLRPGSPAINAGDPALSPSNYSFQFDQRGAPFARFANGRIDIGAYESQPAAGLLNGDFDGDGDVDGRDFLTWQRGVGTTPADKADGDATGNNVVDSQDLAVWQATYGQSGLNTLQPTLIVDHEVTDNAAFLAMEVPSEVSLAQSDETARLGFQVGAITDEKPTEDFDFSAIVGEPLVDETTWDTAFDNWLPQRATFDFGDIATSRAARRTGHALSR